jgi:hypothetical protein
MQPTPYVRFQDYSSYQASHQLPGPAISGADVNADFDRIKATLDATLVNLKLLQRDDGALNNASVTPDTINSALAVMIAGWNIKGAWVTATAYSLKDYTVNAGNGYVCVVAHTSGTFATDLAAGKWALVSTAGATGPQGIQGNPGAAGAPGVTRPGFVNRLINGDFSIDQRNAGAAQTYVAAANVAYGIDRWYASCTGANITGQRAIGTGVNQFAYQFMGAASNTGIVFGHRIESVNVSDLLSQIVTVQVWLSSSSITTATWKAFSANTIDGWGTKSTSGTGTETQIATGTLTITSTPTLYTFQANLSAGVGNGIDLEFSCGALLAAQTIKFEAVQLEFGTIANPFERQDYATRVARCKRYCVVRRGGSQAIPGYSHLPSQQLFSDRLDVEMRAPPTFSISSTSDFTMNINGAAAGCPGFSAIQTDKYGAFLQTTASLGTGFPAIITTANANAWMKYEAEL